MAMKIPEKIRLQMATETLQKIASLPRGGEAKRLAVATLQFITPEPPKRFQRAICQGCGKSRAFSKSGFRPHHHHGEWCKGSCQQPVT
jgi:hypothetical protein